MKGQLTVCPDLPLADWVVIRVSSCTGVAVKGLLAYGRNQVTGLINFAASTEADVVESA